MSKEKHKIFNEITILKKFKIKIENIFYFNSVKTIKLIVKLNKMIIRELYEKNEENL